MAEPCGRNQVSPPLNQGVSCGRQRKHTCFQTHPWLPATNSTVKGARLQSTRPASGFPRKPRRSAFAPKNTIFASRSYICPANSVTRLSSVIRKIRSTECSAGDCSNSSCRPFPRPLSPSPSACGSPRSTSRSSASHRREPRPRSGGEAPRARREHPLRPNHYCSTLLLR